MASTTTAMAPARITPSATTAEQLSLEFVANCTVVQVRGADGSVTLKPGKITFVKRDDTITTETMARMMSIPLRTAQLYVQQGLVEAWQPFANAKWKVSRTSVEKLISGQKAEQRERSLFE